jgi:hypothetical protein
MGRGATKNISANNWRRLSLSDKTLHRILHRRKGPDTYADKAGRVALKDLGRWSDNILSAREVLLACVAGKLT